MPESMFVTCHVSYLDPANGRVEYAYAGRCLPLLSSRRLPGGGLLSSGPALQNKNKIRVLRANNIADEAVRRSFLERVPVNRELMELTNGSGTL